MKLTATILCAVTSMCVMANHVMVDGVYRSPQHGLYPGTERAFQVYVPEQYDGHTAACLYVGLDGVLCNAPAVMDSLIAEGNMPVTIGIFLQPGVIKDEKQTIVRYNRSNEFDATDDRFARFLAQEIIPAAMAMTTPDGRHIILKDKGENHMIFGLSSGGIAAFVAAWHRPDLFGRVFSGVGTFVAMRGGNDLQAIVRKHEPKPLKICLQDGTNDVWNASFGHWYEGNRMLATALDFTGYETKYDWSDCYHGVKRASEIFADVMTWMWSDWGKPIVPGITQNNFLAPRLIADEDWVKTGQTRPSQDSTGSCKAIYPDSSFVVIPDLPASNWLMQGINNPTTGEVTCWQRFYWLHSYDNSPVYTGPMAFDGDGNLWVVTSAGLQVCDQNGRVRGILTLPEEAQRFWKLQIFDDKVVLYGPNTYERRMNIAAPIPGQRPASQGQG